MEALLLLQGFDLSWITQKEGFLQRTHSILLSWFAEITLSPAGFRLPNLPQYAAMPRFSVVWCFLNEPRCWQILVGFIDSSWTTSKTGGILWLLWWPAKNQVRSWLRSLKLGNECIFFWNWTQIQHAHIKDPLKLQSLYTSFGPFDLQSSICSTFLTLVRYFEH